MAEVAPATSVWKEFRDFIARGNVVELAIGVIIGAAFGRIVTDLVEGIIMPPIGMILGRIDFSSLFYVLDASKGMPASLSDAKAKGIPVIAYGQFLNDVFSFLVVASVVFVLVRQVNRLQRVIEPVLDLAPVTRPCPECTVVISSKARRCPHCTSAIEPTHH